MNRRLNETDIETEDTKERFVVRTGKLTFTCELWAPELTADVLTVEWCAGDNIQHWHPGLHDVDNLGGTLKSLDGMGAENIPTVEPGILSRRRFFVIDDSISPGMDLQSSELHQQCNCGYRDIYFAIYDDYTEALQTFASLTGQVPMIPRYALGSWFSRYYPYSTEEYKKIVRRFEGLHIPLDVLVLDVDWHLHGWEGYDWNRELIPDPTSLIQWLHNRQIRTSLNVHPGGMPCQDSHADEAAKRLSAPLTKRVCFNLAESKSAQEYMDLLHRPLMDLGVDFWWIDGDAAHMSGLNSQLRTNQIYYDYTRHYSDERPMILSRYGGFGSQRYPIGFSGDTKSDWAALRYEVYFTATAGNALMPYWSHDIGGFAGNSIDSELYVRWVQFGALSPFLRLHSDHGDRAPWDYGDKVFQAVKKAYELRASLIPYLYSLCYQITFNSIPMVRPMYFEYPDDEECYRRLYQYMLGPDLLICPVSSPSSRGRAHVDVYLPHGTWYDYFTGKRLNGGCCITYSCSLDSVPIFVRAGAILVTQERSERASTPCPNPLTIRAYAGADGSFNLYEDDGRTQAWEKGERVLVHLSTEESDRGISLNIGASEGQFEGWKSYRNISFYLLGGTKPETVTVNQKCVEFDYDFETSECSISIEVDLCVQTSVMFFGSRVIDIQEDKELTYLETAGTLIESGNQTPPQLCISALANDHTDYRTLKLIAEMPEGWGANPLPETRANWRAYDLSIPTRIAPAVYSIGIYASLAIDNQTLSASADIEWSYASVTDFLLIGTFDNSNNCGMDISYGPETDFGYHPMQNGIPWKTIAEDAVVGDIMPLRYIDLTRHFGRINDVVAYAITYIHSESPREVRFDIGSDDGIVAWLNGKEFLRAPEPGPAAPAQFRVPCTLRAGWNQIMLKIGQLFGDWGFYFEIRNSHGDPAEGLHISTEFYQSM